MITLEVNTALLKLKQVSNRPYVFDVIRKKWVLLTPEEHVRQHVIHHLTTVLNYPSALIAVERKILVGKLAKRFDIVVFDRNHKPWMLIECKEPAVDINEKTLYQLISYHSAIPCKYWLLSNGHQNFCAEVSEQGTVQWRDSLPVYG